MFKRLIHNDHLIRTFNTQKTWTVTEASEDVSVSEGIHYPNTAFNPDTDVKNSDGSYKRTVYHLVKHLYYNHTDPFNLFGSTKRVRREIESNIRVINIPVLKYGEQIEKGTVKIVDNATGLTIKDDEHGNLYDTTHEVAYLADNEEEDGHVGNVIYHHGMIVISNWSDYSNLLTGSFTLTYTGNHRIHEHEIHCQIDPHEFNTTMNPSAREGRDPTNENPLAFVITDDFQPYFTTVGLYNDNYELVMVAKFSHPIRKESDIPLTVVVKFDS